MAGELHEIVLRIVEKRGVRTVYRVVLNNVELRGKVVKTSKRGTVSWSTEKGDDKLDHYDPQWLAHRNGRKIVVPIEHPAMAQVYDKFHAGVAVPSEAA